MRKLLDGGSYFEGPRWREDRWWVSDFYRRKVLTVTPDGRTEEVLTVEGEPSGLGWMPDGSLLVNSRKDRKVLRRDPGGELTEHADVSEHCGGDLNDMVVDHAGRAYVGNYGFDLMKGADPAYTHLVRVDPDGTVEVAAGDLLFPNGTVISPDGDTLVLGETAAARLTAFTIEPDGSLTDRRVWAQVAHTPELGPLAESMPQLEFAPDGCTLDAEGYVWAADALGQRVCRLEEGGAIVEEIAAPDGLGFFACMLGGEDGRTLLMCSAPDFAEDLRRQAREAVLYTTEVEVPHAGLP